MADLQKFRRRLIRSVSRLLYKEKKEPEEVWEYLKKETKCDCQALWERMRSLTLKKLNRLLAANDQSNNIAPVARMTLTDWLLFDLVLVHEKIDFIGLDRLQQGLVEYKPLIDLYSLVQRFNIEETEGNDLADAWTAATITYNRQGRQCSPMLLQKRWHQLKSLTRDKFYNFWAAYKGNDKLLETALVHKPTALQMSIAKTYPSVICQPFESWEECVEAGLIILPETFETKMGMKNQPNITQKSVQEKAPDVELVEDTIETIDLGLQSDTDENESLIEDNSNLDIENSNGLNQDVPSSNLTMVKQEPPDEDSLSGVVIEKTSQVDINLQSVDRLESMIEEYPTKNMTEVVRIKKSNNLLTETNMESTCRNTDSLYDPCNETGEQSKDVDKDVVIIKRTRPELKQDRKYHGENIESITEENTCVEVSEDVHESIDIPHKSSAVEDFSSSKFSYTQNEIELEKEIDTTNFNDSLKITEVKTSNTVKETALLNNPTEIQEINTSDECQTDEEKIDCEHSKAPVKIYDKIQDEPIVCGDLLSKNVLTMNENKCFKSSDEEKTDIVMKSVIDESPVIRPDMLNPFDVILPEIEFVDDGIEFVDDGIEFNDNIEDKNISVDVKGSPKEEEEKDEILTFDEKLFLTPVVYTKKLDDMNLFKDKVFSLCDINIINQVALQSKPVSKLASNLKNHEVKSDTSDDLFYNNINSETVSEDESIDESFKVKMTSYLLQKPKTRIYNPIQLCKNPDFNTRLKRLNFGFFGYPRNREYINACIPVTVDVHKSFESKLIDGILYLKPSIKTENIAVANETKIEELKENLVSIKPTPMPVQSLLDSSNLNIKELLPTSEMKTPNLSLNESIICERNKVISLPDKDRIRKINQKLLIAQVAPIIQNEITLEPSNSIEILDPPSKHATESEEAISVPVPKDISFEESKKEGINGDNSLCISNKQKTIPDLKKKQLAKKAKPKHIAVPWNTKSVTVNNSKRDYLLARDTLSKVLYILGSENKKLSEIPGTSKNAKKFIDSALKETENKLNRKSKSKKKAAPQAINEAQNEDCPVPKTPKIVCTIKSYRSGKKKYCCWANKTLKSIQKNCRLKIGNHTCLTGFCKCCCMDMLMQERESKEKAKSNVIELSEDEDDMKKACASIESVVKQAHDPKNEPLLVPAVHSNAEVSCSFINTTFNISTSKSDIAIDNKIDDSSLPVSINNCETSIPKVDNEIELESTSELTSTIPIESYSPETTNLETHTTSAAPTNSPISPTNSVNRKRIIPVKRPRVQVVRCQCKEPNIVTSHKRHLIIDGSITCPLHSKKVSKTQNTQRSKTKDTVLFVNKSRDVQNPIFVGHNKILLTSVSYNKTDIPQIPELSPIPIKNSTALITVSPLVQTPVNSLTESAIDNSVVIPNGVELKLSENGTLTFSVDPGVTLDDEVLASLPIIVSTLQQQIDQNKLLGSTAEFVANESSKDQAENTSKINRNLNISAKEQDLNQDAPSVDMNTTTDQSTATDIEITAPKPLHDENNSLIDDNRQCSNSVTEVLDSEQLIHNDNEASKLETINAATKQNTNSPELTFSPQSPSNNYEQKSEDGKVKSKSTLLSDLMEMSGIIAEDTLPVLQVPITSSVVSESGLTIKEPQNKQVNNDHPMLAHSSESISFKDPLQLSVIHSFAHLKYACQQNGIFFKLDLQTGILVSINVCLKKNSPKHNKKASEFIDLTLESEDKQKDSRNDLNEDTIAITNESNIKPLKLFKSLRPTILSKNKFHQISLRKKFKSVTGEIVRCRKEKRKQNIRKNNIEAKIDLVDSDEPMEEEYLVDSSTDTEKDSYSNRNVKKRDRVEVSENESSDDEPLAKKALRTKNQQEINEKGEYAKETQKVNFNGKQNIESLAAALDSGLETTIMELPPQVVVDSIEMVTESEEGPTALAFLNNQQNQNSSGEEDCILGF